MDTLFVNQYYRTKEIEDETQRYIFFRRSGMLFLLILFAILFFLQLAALLLGKSDSFYFLIFTPVYYIINYFSYRSRVKMSVKQVAEMYGENPLIYFEIAQTQLRSYGPRGSQNVIFYENIKHAAETKNLILLWSNANVVYILHKGGFGPASYLVFLNFLTSKGIKVK